TRGARRDPHADRGAGLLRLDDARKDSVREGLERLAVAEEARDADEDVLVERAELFRRALDELDVVLELLDLVERQAPLDAALDRARLVVREVVPERGADQ